jgi:hypothetical protein
VAKDAAPRRAPPGDPEMDARRCLRSAQQFMKASQRAALTGLTSDGEAFDQSADIPAVVCAAFAIELAFKCILLVERRESWTGHQLEQLFGQLSRGSQQQIEGLAAETSYFLLLGNTQTRTQFFGEVLASLSGVFEDWRYVYEKDTDLAVDLKFLHRLANACLDVAERLTSSTI